MAAESNFEGRKAAHENPWACGAPRPSANYILVPALRLLGLRGNARFRRGQREPPQAFCVLVGLGNT